MKRELLFNTSIIGGIDKDFICELFPSLESKFTRRKEYYEYYFDNIVVELDIDIINKLSNSYRLAITQDTIIVEI